jgi:heterodisulfide reductase subunit C
VEEMDIVPSEVIRYLQLGQPDIVLNSKTIWICASCLQCASRCPKGVEFSSICDALRAIVLRKRVSTPKVDADELSRLMVSDAPQMGVVGALRKLNG